MKFFKSLIFASLAATALGFTACSDDDPYTPGSDSQGVYFAEAPSTIELTSASTSFEVTVSRAGITDAATYPVTITTDAPDGALSYPSEVSFAQGEATTTLAVSVVPSLLTTAENYTFTVKLGDGVTAFNYGDSEVSFTVVRVAPWSEYQPYKDGKASYVYGIVYSGSDTDLDFSYCVNTEDPTQEQYKLDGMIDGAFDLTFTRNTTTNNLSVPPTPTGLTVSVSGATYEWILMDLGTYAQLSGQYSEQEVETLRSRSYYDPDEDIFHFYMAWTVYDDDEQAYSLLRFSDGSMTAGEEQIILGEPVDASIDFSFAGTLVGENGKANALFNVNAGADTEAGYLAMSKTLGAQELLSAMLQGQVSTVEFGAGENQSVKYPVTEGGDYVAVAITVIGDEPQAAAAVECSVILGNNDANDPDWQDVAVVDFIDGWVTAAFTFTAQDGSQLTYSDLGWQLQGQQSTKDPNIYRIKSPWTDENCPLVIVGANSNTKPVDMVIDVTNKNVVRIVPYYCGATVPLQGTATPFYIGNFGGYATLEGIADEALIAKGYNDVWDDGYIKIPMALFGMSDNMEEFGYTWKSNPVSEIFFDLSGSAQSAHKIARHSKKPVSFSAFNAAVKSKFRLNTAAKNKNRFKGFVKTIDNSKFSTPIRVKK